MLNGFVHSFLCADYQLCIVCAMQEFKEATRNKTADTGITLVPNELNIFVWKAQLKVLW
jgi:hypothetical protein